MVCRARYELGTTVVRVGMIFNRDGSTGRWPVGPSEQNRRPATLNGRLLGRKRSFAPIRSGPSSQILTH